MGELYCGNNLDILPKLKDNSFDLCVTDPPYAMGKEFEKGLKLDNIIPQYTKLVYDKLKEDSWFVYTCPCKNIDYFIEKTKEVGFKFERILFYYKKGKFTDVWVGWLLKSEAILLFSKGKPNKSNSNKPKYNHDVYTIPSYATSDERFVNHQSAKHLETWKHLITSLSGGGDLILDPFIGSGTTAIACEELERRWVGIELNQSYCDMVVDRLCIQNKPLSLFDFVDVMN